MRQYFYVGSDDLRDLIGKATSRKHIQRASDVLDWLHEFNEAPNSDGAITFTFIVNTKGELWIAHQRSEHVVCAQGGQVLSAGEMTFSVGTDKVEVIEATNQSTGFCPEPESWTVVAAALARIGIEHPPAFTTEYLFRLCTACGMRNIIKELWFECAVCGEPLDHNWNFDQHAKE